jgi:hypothetical protein
MTKPIRFIVEIENLPADMGPIGKVEGQVKDAIVQAIEEWLQIEGTDDARNVSCTISRLYGDASIITDDDEESEDLEDD